MPRIQKKAEVREVSDLFNADRVFEAADVQLTPELVSYYRSVAPFAFAVERQSEGMKVLGDPDKTGHEGRVSSILRLARDLHLPAPEEREDRQKGELSYVFDQRHWFIDGTEGKATGWSARPEIRPELWRAYALARRLKEKAPDAAPVAFIVGDPTRFFRDYQWFQVWAQALKREGIDLRAEGYEGLSSDLMLQVMAFQVRALSEQLPKSRKNARQEKKRRGELFETQLPFGLRHVDRREIWTEPDEWEVIREVVQRLADGRLGSAEKAVAWMRETYGDTIPRLPRSDAWVRTNLLGERNYLEAEAYVAFRREFRPCRIKERTGLNWELDFTESGQRRYVAEEKPDESLAFPIHYTPGTEPIPAEVFHEAQRRVRQRGRRYSGIGVHRHHCIVASRLVRCAVCGDAVEERGPQADAPEGKMWNGWYLQCRCLQTVKAKNALSPEEARQRPEVQHTRYLAASLSLPLRDLLWHRLFGGDLDLERYAGGETPSTDQSRRADLEKRKTEAQASLERIAEGVASGTLNLEIMADAIRKQQEKAQQAIQEADRELAALNARTFNEKRQSAHLAELRAVCERAREHVFGDFGFWRELTEALVERVVVDLDAGTFTADLNLSEESVRRIEGRLGGSAGSSHANRISVETYSGCGRLSVSLSGRLRAA